MNDKVWPKLKTFLKGCSNIKRSRNVKEGRNKYKQNTNLLVWNRFLHDIQEFFRIFFRERFYYGDLRKDNISAHLLNLFLKEIGIKYSGVIEGSDSNIFNRRTRARRIKINKIER